LLFSPDRMIAHWLFRRSIPPQSPSRQSRQKLDGGIAILAGCNPAFGIAVGDIITRGINDQLQVISSPGAFIEGLPVMLTQMPAALF
jgi:hypothetical protein